MENKFQTYNTTLKILSDKLREELSNPPLDEGNVFSILDIVLLSIEKDENSYLINIWRKFTKSLIKTLLDLDKYLGHGFIRIFKLIIFSPKILSKLLSVSHEIDDNLNNCMNMVNSLKKLYIVRFIVQSGGTFITPVIRKWLQSRSFKITQQEWEEISTKLNS